MKVIIINKFKPMLILHICSFSMPLCYALQAYMLKQHMQDAQTAYAGCTFSIPRHQENTHKYAQTTYAGCPKSICRTLIQHSISRCTSVHYAPTSMPLDYALQAYMLKQHALILCSPSMYAQTEQQTKQNTQSKLTKTMTPAN